MNKYLNPNKYYSKFIYLYNKYRFILSYDLNEIQKIERNKFINLGLSYEDLIIDLNKILLRMELGDFESQKGLMSVHWLLFCAISKISNIKRVLEIGTSDGTTASLLSNIFNKAEIVTLDLPKDDPIYRKYYRRDNKENLERFEENRGNIKTFKNIQYIEKNSFYLPKLISKKFDLIWIDGGHLYPEIAWDICNAYHMCKKGGWILCDDVICTEKDYKDDYVSTDSFRVLEYIKERSKEEIIYFFKRESSAWSQNPRTRKYVALMKICN